MLKHTTIKLTYTKFIISHKLRHLKIKMSTTASTYVCVCYYNKF